VDAVSGADGLNPAYGGRLIDLQVSTETAAELRRRSADWPSWVLTPRQICDLELLVTGAFSPLNGFMGRTEYDSVCRSMRLASGLIWPLPIVLDVSDDLAQRVTPGGIVALRDPEGRLLASLRVEDVWARNLADEATLVYRTTDERHPGLKSLFAERTQCLGGSIVGIEPSPHYDFASLRLTPTQVRQAFRSAGWRTVIAFQTRNPLHRAHVELTRRALEEVPDAHLLVQPVVGVTKPGDIDHYTRVRCYQAVLSAYPAGMAKLALLPLAMRMAGPREALWHAIIRRNYGCTHLVVGRDHAGPGVDSRGVAFYGPYDAQALLREHEGAIGMRVVPSRELVFVPSQQRYVDEPDVPGGAEVARLSGTELRRLLTAGEPIPEWFTFPEVVRELRRTHPPRSRQGFTVFFTGLSGAGKSTIANILLVRLLADGARPVTLLDGDLVRRHLTSELGFSKEHRDLNIQRIGFVASEITRHGGVALCAAIAPYDDARRKVRSMIEPVGGYVLVHVATPLEICEERDHKGLYAKARAGALQQFTGISDPYESPTDPDIVIDGSVITADVAAEEILEVLSQRGFFDLGGVR
jgi:sulfate adenylyltransferase